MVTSREAPIFTSIPGMHSYQPCYGWQRSMEKGVTERWVSWVKTSINKFLEYLSLL